MSTIESRTVSQVGSLITSALAQAPFAALLLKPDEQLTLIWRNDAHAELSDSVGRAVEGKPMFEAFPPPPDAQGATATEAIRASVKKIAATRMPDDIGPYRFDLVSEGGSYVEHHWQMQMSPVIESDRVVAILQVAQDVTDKVLSATMEETLRRAAHSTAAVNFFSFDPETDVFIRSPGIDEMFGFEIDEAGVGAAPFFERVHPDDVQGVHAEVERVFNSKMGEVASFDYRVALPDGRERFLRIRGEVATDPIDRRNKLVGTFVDLTDIENNRRFLIEALEMKDAIVQEANHRIKNSLAIASSILRIEERAFRGRDTVTESDVLEALSKIANRIHAVSNAHGLMQLRDKNTSVSLQTLCERLVKYSRETAGLSVDELAFDYAGADVWLDSTIAVNLSLILNEIITNALKYGVSEDEHTRITVDAKIDENGIEIRVGNTKAASRKINDIPSTQLGSSLVEQLARQIDAVIDVLDVEDIYRTRLTLPRGSTA